MYDYINHNNCFNYVSYYLHIISYTSVVFVFVILYPGFKVAKEGRGDSNPHILFSAFHIVLYNYLVINYK
jgi:hypothetical protein